MADVFQRLCHMYPESGVGMVGLGSVLLHQKEFVMARSLLQKGKSLVSVYVATYSSDSTSSILQSCSKQLPLGYGFLHF